MHLNLDRTCMERFGWKGDVYRDLDHTWIPRIEVQALEKLNTSDEDVLLSYVELVFDIGYK